MLQANKKSGDLQDSDGNEPFVIINNPEALMVCFQKTIIKSYLHS